MNQESVKVGSFHVDNPSREYVSQMSAELAHIAETSGMPDVASLLRIVSAVARKST